MSSIVGFAKLSACIAVVGVIVIYPIGFGSGRTEDKSRITEKASTDEEGATKIGWVNSSKGSSLSLINIKSLSEKVRKKGDRATFKEVGMKWGKEALTEHDILFSPCLDGEYYLMKGNNGSKYTLEDGTPMGVTLRCHEIEDPKYQKLNHVKMKWNSIYRISSLPPDKISLGSCFFTKKDETSYWITCYKGFKRGRAFGESFYGFVEFDKKN